MVSRDPRWVQDDSKGPKMASRSIMMAPGSRFGFEKWCLKTTHVFQEKSYFLMSRAALDCPTTGQHRLMSAQEKLLGPQVDPRSAQDGPKMVSRSSQESQDRAKLGPRLLPEVPVGPKMISKGPKMTPRAIIMALGSRLGFEKCFLEKNVMFS